MDPEPVLPATDDTFLRAMRHMEDVLREIENGPDSRTRHLARQLTQTLLDLHRKGLAKIWELLEDGGRATEVFRDACLHDPLVSSLFMLHDLHPVAIETRVAKALDKVRPRLRSHGGDVELIGIADGSVRLRLVGQCDGCPSAGQTMEHLVENALYEMAADVVSVLWENTAAQPVSLKQGLVPLVILGQR